LELNYPEKLTHGKDYQWLKYINVRPLQRAFVLHENRQYIFSMKIRSAAPPNRKTQPIYVYIYAAWAEIQSNDTIQDGFILIG
jgi:hypothetical protein